MGSAPQQANSPMSSSLVTQALGRVLPQLDASSQISGTAPQMQQQQLQSGMPPPAQPQAVPASPASSGQSMAPITQQLQQAVQPGSTANTATPGDSFVGQMGQQNSLAMLLSQWGL